MTMDYFSSVWFKIGLVLVLLLVINGIYAYTRMSSLTRVVAGYSAERKSKLNQSIAIVLSISKVAFWILPIYLFLVPAIFIMDKQLAYSIITLIPFLYIALIETFFISREILKAIGK